MKHKFLLVPLIFVSLLIIRCGNNSTKQTDSVKSNPLKDTVVIAQGSNAKGVGRFKDVALTHPLDSNMIAKAEPIYNAKCFACHKLTDEKLVGPGWKGVTDRRAPEWIMNFVTNTDEMLDKDAEAKALMEVCMVRMPNQNLKDDEARAILEFMRKNDGKN